MKKIYLACIAFVCLFCNTSFSQCATPTTAPYYEDFNAITANNQLPSCWTISNPATCVTFTTSSTQGNPVFYYTPSGSNYFYSMGIQLYAGITYSASAWYKVATNNNITWTDFSIMLGTSQSSTGLALIASTNGAAVNIIYTAVTNTFNVATSGVYYVAIRGISNGSSSGSPYLTWDDLAITIPCTPAYNSPSLTVVTNTSTICNGQTFSTTITGADTYSWSNGSTASAFTATPNQSIQYSVVGTNTLSGCTSTLSLPLVTVKQPPSLIITSDKSPTLCLGSSANLTTGGSALTYSWSTGSTTTTALITPTATTVYSVVVTGTNGCSSTMSYTATVNPLPVFTHSSSAATHTVCKGELVTFTASSAANLNYQWSSSSIPVSSGDVFSLTASFTTTLNIKGSDQFGCDNSTSYVFNVDNCTGVMKSTAPLGFKIYPNPGNGGYTVESGNSELKSLVVTDVMGKIIFTSETYNEQLKIDIEKFPAGIYNAKINSVGKTETIKLIKN